jgi:hypothetical protein
MTNEEANVILVGMLIDEWTPQDIDASFDEESRISTGWWNEDNAHPQITVTSITEDPSYDGINPSGAGATSWVNGTVDVNVWVANDRDATDGLHPKILRHQLRKEVEDVITDHATGYEYVDPDGGTHFLTRVEPTGTDSNVETGNEPTVFRYTIETSYVYHKR